MKGIVKCLSFCLVIVQIICIAPNIIFAADGVGYTSENHLDIEGIISPVISSPISDIDIPVRVSFDNTDVLTYSVEASGLTATEVSAGSMQYDILATGDFGTLTVFATYMDGTERSSSVYTYREANKVYLSDISQDQAWYDCIKLMYDNGEITYDELKNAYSELTKSYLMICEDYSDDNSNNSSSESKTTVTGELLWELQNGAIAPLVKSKVELIKLSGGREIVLATQYTLQDGKYTFEINNEIWNDQGEDIFIRFWLESETYKVTNNWILEQYSYDVPVIANACEGVVVFPAYCIKSDLSNIQYKATYVHQAMTISERFALEMGMPKPGEENAISKLNVAYPSVAPSDSAGCFEIIDGFSFAAIGRNRYGMVDTITHEYGHYVQHTMETYGATLCEIINNWPEHNFYYDHFTDKISKEYAMELTWSEAWACAFSTLCERYYWEQYEYTYFDPNVMFKPEYKGRDLESPFSGGYDFYDHDGQSSTPRQDNRGEAQEYAVAAFLWDVFDDISSAEAFDDMQLGYQSWWNYTTQQGMYTLEDFVYYIDEDHPEYRDSIGELLTYHNISPRITNITGYSSSVAPTITFVVNGSEAHPNNRFVVYFYDQSGRYLGETAMIQSSVAHGSSITITVEQNIWESVIEASETDCGDVMTVNVSVGGYRYDDTSEWISDSIREYSGPYYSKYEQITVNLSHNYSYEIYDSSQHRCICNNCGESYLASHVADPSYIDPTGRFAKCRYCDALYRTTTITPIIKNKITIDEEIE